MQSILKRGTAEMLCAITLCLFVAAGCSKRDDLYTIISVPSERTKIEVTEDEFVTMYVLPEVISINSSAKLIIENHTKRILTYGAPFSLEYLEKESWKEIKLDVAWESIQYGISAGDTTEEQFNLSLIKKFNNSKKGRYRIVRDFGLYYHFPFGECSSFILHAEFEIK